MTISRKNTTTRKATKNSGNKTTRTTKRTSTKKPAAAKNKTVRTPAKSKTKTVKTTRKTAVKKPATGIKKNANSNLVKMKAELKDLNKQQRELAKQANKLERDIAKEQKALDAEVFKANLEKLADDKYLFVVTQKAPIRGTDKSPRSVKTLTRKTFAAAQKVAATPGSTIAAFNNKGRRTMVCKVANRRGRAAWVFASDSAEKRFAK